MAPPDHNDRVDPTVPKVVSYILFDWLTKRMDINCLADAIVPPPQQGPKAMFLCQQQTWLPPPLHFKTMEVIVDRHYSLELEKQPDVYWLKELNVKWLPHLDAKTPPEFFRTILTNKVVPHPTGFYRVISEVSEDYEYLVKLLITRV